MLLAACAALILVAGCAAPPPPTPEPTQAADAAPAAPAGPSNPLTATAWQLDNFGSPDESEALIPDTTATVTYFLDQYTGFDGCNWFLGDYSADATGSLRMQTPSMTMNVCDSPELNSQASTFVSSLLDVVTYEMQGDQMVQNATDSQPLLTFSPAAPVPAAGTTWEVLFQRQEDGASWSPMIPETSVVIIFGDNNQAMGEGGCNDYVVAYDGEMQLDKALDEIASYTELPTLTFGAVKTQGPVCSSPEGVMEQQAAYFALLPQVVYYAKVGGTMLLIDREGAPLLALSAQTQ
jgi:heat shock protein HslJ